MIPASRRFAGAITHNPNINSDKTGTRRFWLVPPSLDDIPGWTIRLYSAPREYDTVRYGNGHHARSAFLDLRRSPSLRDGGERIRHVELVDPTGRVLSGTDVDLDRDPALRAGAEGGGRHG